MTNLDNEKLVNYLVVLEKPGRRFVTEPDTRWGGLILPDPSEVRDRTRAGLRVALLGSWAFGYLVLETLKEYERKFPGNMHLVGLATDDPLNPDARISFRKRVWRLLDPPDRAVDETSIIESGLLHGIPVYTGEVKIESFYRLLQEWRPDAILVCVFGQVIDSRVIGFPAYGIYNFHPSDLLQRQGAGPAPYDDLAARKAGSTVWSLHHVTEEVDGGHVVGQSPPVNVLNTRGLLPPDPLVVYEKLAEALSPLAFFLVDELCRRFRRNQPGAIEHVDFDGLISGDVKTRILQPIVSDTPADTLPMPDRSLFS